MPRSCGQWRIPAKGFVRIANGSGSRGAIRKIGGEENREQEQGGVLAQQHQPQGQPAYNKLRGRDSRQAPHRQAVSTAKQLNVRSGVINGMGSSSDKKQKNTRDKVLPHLHIVAATSEDDRPSARAKGSNVNRHTFNNSSSGRKAMIFGREWSVQLVQTFWDKHH